MGKHIPNMITGCHILGSVFMLFFPVFSAPFYILYLLFGLSDMADGAVARKTNHTSELGAKLDSAADVIFAAASFMKFLPLIQLPGWLWIWVIAIGIIKISNLILGVIYRKTFLSLHTILNKTTGLLLFLLPLTLHFIELKYSSVVVCSIATLSAIQEGYHLGTGREVV